MAEKDYADPPMMLRSVEESGYIRTNDAFKALVGFSNEELENKSFKEWICEKDLISFQEVIAGDKESCVVNHKTKSGKDFSLLIRVVQHDNKSIILAREKIKTHIVSSPKDSDDEATVKGTLHKIAQIVEAENPDFKCSILLVADGKFVRGAGPSLPEEYNSAIDGFAIGPTVGSCGTAIYWNVPVIVTDIQKDPLWIPFRELAKKAGVSSCWSHPFISTSGNVLGALAFYSPEPRTPTKEELSRLKAAASMTGLAVERGRAEESLIKKRQRELELEEQLRQAAKMEALGVLAGGVAHDFNNVLSTILSNAEFAQEFIEKSSEAQDMLEDIVEASKRAGQFCLQMLAYAGRGTLSRSQVEIGALVPEISNLVKAAASKNTTIKYNLHKNPIFIEADDNQLLQVLMNLVTNAADAIGDKEGEIEIKSSLKDYNEQELLALDPRGSLRVGEYVCLSVTDNGPGMSLDTISKIFDPFYTTKVTGHGLGLSAVKGIIGKHGGAIDIESKIGEGTKFKIILPTIESANKENSLNSNSSKEFVGRKKILIAENERKLRSIFSKILKHAGFEVLEASNGLEALDIFSTNKDEIDCVLMDVSLPKLDFTKTNLELQKLKAGIPIVMMSGYSEEEISEKFIDSEVSACLQKPISSESLLSVVRETLS